MTPRTMQDYHLKDRGKRFAHPEHRCSSSLTRFASKRARLRLSLEQLEQRHLLAADPWLWFQSFDEVPRLEPSELAATSQQPDVQAMGPHDLVASEWIVQLSDAAKNSVRSLESLNARLQMQPVEFTVIRGLGSPGLVLLRGRGVTRSRCPRGAHRQRCRCELQPELDHRGAGNAERSRVRRRAHAGTRSRQRAGRLG